MIRKLALYSAVSIAAFVVGTAVSSNAQSTPTPSASASAKPSASPSAHPTATATATNGALFMSPGSAPRANGGTGPGSSGQFGFTPSATQPPVMVPNNPGMQFVPPPSFSATGAPAAPSKPGTVDCIVR